MGGTHRGETDLNRGLLKRILVLGEAGATSDCLQNREWHLAGGRHTERIIVRRVYGTHWQGQHERCRHQVHSDGPYHVKGHFKIVTDGDREIAFDRNEAGSAGAAIRRTSHSATAHTRRAASRTTWTRSRNRHVNREEPFLYVIALRHKGEQMKFPVEGVDGGSISMLTVQVG